MTKINHNDWIEDTPEEKAEKDKIRAQIEFEMANPAPLVPPTEEEIAADKAMVEKIWEEFNEATEKLSVLLSEFNAEFPEHQMHIDDYRKH